MSEKEELLSIEQPQPNKIIITITTDDIEILSNNNNNYNFLKKLGKFITNFMENH